MKSIRLVNGHFDGETEKFPGEPRVQVHKRLPHGDWVDSITGKPVTHDVYRLTTGADTKRIYTCNERSIEKSTWLKFQELKQAR